MIRRYLILNDQYNQSKREMARMKARINELIPSEEEHHKKLVERKNLDHVLEHQKVKLNDTIGTNNKLRTDIDIIREELK